MKNIIRYILSTLIFLLAGTLSAQVAEFHLNENLYGESYISKYYLSDYDSIVYIPAQDWSISAEIDSCYEDEASHEVRIITTITVGPNADVARVGFGDVRNAVAPYVVLKKGTTQTLDFVVPEKDKTCTFGMYTMNNYHTYKYGDYYYGDYYNSIAFNYAEWLENRDWNDIGTGYFYDGFLDDYLWQVSIQQNKYDKNSYRVLNPYKGMWNYWGEYSFAEASSKYFEFRILEKGEELGGVEITKDGLVYFSPVNSGYFHSSYNDYIWAYHPAHFTIASEELYANSYIAGYKEDGTPGDILIAPYYYIPGVGGWNYTTEPGMIEIIMPGYVPNYNTDTWIAKNVGTYTYSQFFEGDDEGLTLYQSQENPERFKIENWGGGVDFIFILNDNNEITFDEFYVGYTHPSYGDVMAYDMNALYPSEFSVGYYADDVFHFQIGYGVDAGWFGYGEETFTLTNNKAKARTATKSPIQVGKSSQSIPSKLNIKQPNGKKIQRVHRLNAGSRTDKPTQVETPRIPLLQSAK